VIVAPTFDGRTRTLGVPGPSATCSVYVLAHKSDRVIGYRSPSDERSGF
jgi:hypothetical protein